MAEVVSHLWQSTVFAVAVAVVCRLLRDNAARTRYWLWLAASVKFLVPFSLLVAVGDRVDFPVRGAVTGATVQAITATFSPGPEVVAPVTVEESQWPLALAIVWGIGVVVLTVRLIVAWLRLRTMAVGSTPAGFDFAVPVRVTDRMAEPGVFGIVRPLLLVPEGLTRVLPGEQLRAVLAHELCHVRCWDNLTYAVHMAVATVFWFHPAVWWIGLRLLEERERACDEAVMGEGLDPREYAAGIAAVCRYYLRSPLGCAAGVTGSNLKRRIREIMAGRMGVRLSRGRKLGLVVLGLMAVVGPVGVGMLRGQAETFEVVSVKRSDPGARGLVIQFRTGGGQRVVNARLRQLIMQAYDAEKFQVVGGPSWVDTEGFDIEVKGEELVAGDGAAMERWLKLMRARMRSLLAERFRLVVREERKEAAVLVLRVEKNGHKLKASTEGFDGISGMPGQIVAEKVEMKNLAAYLSGQLGRRVVDQTGLSGTYAFRMRWTPEGNGGPLADEKAGGAAPVAEGGPALNTAIQGQLGLRLESSEGVVPVYVIERVERPEGN
ncbi:MAG: TIGR03435 family protein [Acidobacteria bacterium]|nr:TIGR03435 family protein [Acidobacteriota bacterium]